jgi:hypothetical protein
VLIIHSTDGCVGPAGRVDDIPLAGSAVSLDGCPLVGCAVGLDDIPLPTIEPRFLSRPSRSLATIPTKLSEVLKQ